MAWTDEELNPQDLVAVQSGKPLRFASMPILKEAQPTSQTSPPSVLSLGTATVTVLVVALAIRSDSDSISNSIRKGTSSLLPIYTSDRLRWMVNGD